MTRKIIMIADDFGQSPENNAGVLAAHQAGMLNAASLMVGGVAVDEAIQIARDNPSLPVGLHLCLSDGPPVLPPVDIPLLVGEDGRFPPNEALLSQAVRSRRGRAQLRAEIAAQFAAFARTGFVLDHVNVHRNSHMRHPLIANEVFRAAAKAKAMLSRIPYDPTPNILADGLRRLRLVALRRLARFYGLTVADRSIGRVWSDARELAALIISLPDGVTELYFHPVVCETAHLFRYDLPILLSRDVQHALRMVEWSHGRRSEVSA